MTLSMSGVTCSRLHALSTIPAGLIRLVLYCPDDDDFFAYILGAIAERADPELWVGSDENIENTTYWFREALLATARKERAMYVSQIIWLAGTIADTDILPADGREIEIDAYSDLYAVVGDVFGPAAAGFFRLPDIGARTIVGVGSNGSDTRVIGDNGGSNSVSLTLDNLPSHDHTIHGHMEGVALTPGELPVTLPGSTGSTGSAGGGQSIDVANPYIALYPYIVVR